MSFDNSRIIYNSWKDYLGLITLQGRVQLDSDWNDFQGQFLRRIQAGTLDTLGQNFGQAIYPQALKYSFNITVNSPSQILIGAGRVYVDGLLVENHGPMNPGNTPTPTAWDPVLAELSNTWPDAGYVGVDYLSQPYYPNPPAPSAVGPGPYLVYLDVWQRPVTYIEDPNLLEIAVGVDTTGRLQTAWQVRLMDASSAGPQATCAAATALAAWANITQSSGGQLTTALAPPPQTGPCILTANTGYTGMENQFYRVEIHQPGGFGPAGATGTATFKWSRENASVLTAVLGINNSATNTAGKPSSSLTVQSLGRDQVLGFNAGDWIELIDDYLELNGSPGELHLIDSVTPSTKTITLVSSINNQGNFPLTNGLTDATRHTRIRRWDQQGIIYQSDYTTPVTDLGQPGSSGDIPLTGTGFAIALENGVTVALTLNQKLGPFKTGDFWTFAARTSNGSVEIITDVPPRGIHHHYAPLAVVPNFTGTPSDCRAQWPPAPAGTTSCGCTIIVQPGEVTATNTLQQIITQVISQGQGASTVICLQSGTYDLPAPLRIPAGSANLTIEACQAGTAILQATGPGPDFLDGLVSLYGSNQVTLRGLYFQMPVTTISQVTDSGLLAGLLAEVKFLAGVAGSIGVRAVNCTGLTIEECQFDFSALADLDTTFAVGIFAGGACSQWRLAGNEFTGTGGFQAGFLHAPTVTAFNPAKKKLVVPQRGESLSYTKGEAILERAATPGLAASDGGKAVAAFLNDTVLVDNTFNGLTVAALVHAQCQTVDFHRNECDSCLAGFWLVAPTQAELVLYSPQGVGPELVMVVGLLVALAYPLPQQPAPAPATVTVAVAPAAIRIYAGAAKTDGEGNEWSPDAKYATGGKVSPIYKETITNLASTDTPSAGDEFIYLIERYGDTFSYTFGKLAAGYYAVTLKFAEIYYTGKPGDGPLGRPRIFNVTINGTQFLVDFDVATDAQGALTADDKVFYNIMPQNVSAGEGEIVIQFDGTTLKNGDAAAKISGVEILPQWAGTVPAIVSTMPALTSSLFDAYAQFSQLAQQSFASLAPVPLQLRLTDNELHGLFATAILVLWDDQLQNGNASSLMMTGNRLDTSFVAGNSDTWAIVTRMVKDNLLSNLAPYNFFFAVNLTWVTRCVVSANLVLNQHELASGSSLGRGSLLLNNVSLPLPVLTVPPAEVMVAGNVFQGTSVIVPARSFSTDPKPPAPMNTWDFLNTTIP